MSECVKKCGKLMADVLYHVVKGVHDDYEGNIFLAKWNFEKALDVVDRLSKEGCLPEEDISKMRDKVEYLLSNYDKTYKVVGKEEEFFELVARLARRVCKVR